MTAKCEEMSIVFSVISVILQVFGFAYQILNSQMSKYIEIKSDLKENIDWVLSNLGCPTEGYICFNVILIVQV